MRRVSSYCDWRGGSWILAQAHILFDFLYFTFFNFYYTSIVVSTTHFSTSPTFSELRSSS